MTKSTNLLSIFAIDPAFDGGRPFHVCTVEYSWAKNAVDDYSRTTPAWHFFTQRPATINQHAISQIKSPDHQGPRRGDRKSGGRPKNAFRVRATDEEVAEVSREAPECAHRLGGDQPGCPEEDRASARLDDLPGDASVATANDS